MYSLENLLIYYLHGLGMGVGMILAARRLTHYFQLESYQFLEYFQTIGRQWNRAIDPYLFLGLCYFIVYAAFAFLTAPVKGNMPYHLGVSAVAGGLYALAGWLVRRNGMKQKEKKPFALTARMKRLYGILALLLVLYPGAFYLLFHGELIQFGLFSALSACVFPYIIALAGLLALPIECVIHTSKKKGSS
jgi:hypothetical protein